MIALIKEINLVLLLSQSNAKRGILLNFFRKEEPIGVEDFVAMNAKK
jgi:hypothetical protein